MGGFGSGRRFSSTKDTTDGCHFLDINLLLRRGELHPGRWSCVSWSRNGEPSGSILALASEGLLTLQYRSQSYGSEWEDVVQPTRITWTGCHFGGRRPWFVCPGAGCGRRVGKLFANGKYFLCRHCYALAYQSQREDAAGRALLKTQNIRVAPRREAGPHTPVSVEAEGHALAHLLAIGRGSERSGTALAGRGPGVV